MELTREERDREENARAHSVLIGMRAEAALLVENGELDGE